MKFNIGPFSVNKTFISIRAVDSIFSPTNQIEMGRENLE